MDQLTKREIIMAHYESPLNQELPETDEYVKINSNNSSCIDNIDLYIKFDSNIISDIKFSGEACAISTSSTSIMIKNLIGKTIKEAYTFIDNFEKMINEQPYNEELLEEAIVYDEIYKQNNRKDCAYLPYRGIKKALEQQFPNINPND